MKHKLLCSLFFFAATYSYGQFNTTMQVQYAKAVGDSFEIYTSLPATYNPTTAYNVVYYCDANLKSGKHLRVLLSSNEYHHLNNTIFVGIGHIGNYHVPRRRDFILPFINGQDTIGQNKNYGQTEKFYAYLKDELIPAVNTKYKTNLDSNAILGHSLGGLFAFFCLFKSDNVFAKYFALSPALWIDKYAIYRFNKINTGFGRHQYLYFSAGSQETLNKILKGANGAKQFLDEKQYTNLVYEYDVWQGKTHNSAVPPTLEKILKEKL